MHNLNQRETRCGSLAVVFALAAFGAIAAAWGGQTQHTKTKTAPKTLTPAPPAAMAAPFAVGETLQYQVLWTQFSVHAATLDFSVAEERDFFGRLAWHFRTTAHTINTMRLAYTLDDQFDSYADALQLNCLQYEMYLNEQGKTENSKFRTSTQSEPVPPNATLVRVLPGTRDPVGLLYALRAADWQHIAEFRAPTFDGHRIYDVRARVEIPSGQVTVPAGQIAATRIAIHLSERGSELQDTRFWLWLAHDPARTPVLIEAEVPFGTARIELLQMPRH